MKCLLLLVALALAPGCRRGHSAAADSGIPYGLGRADADDRKEAAEDLRDEGGPHADAVPHLLAAVARETDGEARAEMLITLGASGAPEAKPVLDAALNDADRDTKKGAERGLALWGKKNGRATPEQLREIERLKHEDWDERLEAAEELGEDGGPPADAVGPLVAAAQKEQHPKALGEMLLVLGRSGAPEAKPLIDQHLAAPNGDLRRQANKASKLWLAKQSAAPAGPAAAAPDGCDQFKEICGEDPFDLARCKADLKPLAYEGQVAWAECVNSSSETCEKAHQTCLADASGAKKP